MKKTTARVLALLMALLLCMTASAFAEEKTYDLGGRVVRKWR